MRVLASAPGKLILLGEYAVLEGAPAIVTAINRYAKTSFAPHIGKVSTFSSPTLGLKNLPFLLDQNDKIFFKNIESSTIDSQLIFIKLALERFYQNKNNIKKRTSCKIITNTDQFYQDVEGEKFGFGSSAALTTSLLGALYFFGKVFDRYDRIKIFKETLAVHFQSQGKRGSGIDVAASVYGGILRYQIFQNAGNPKWSIKNLSAPSQLIIVPIWTGKSASTAKLLGQTENFKKNHYKNYVTLIEKFQDLCFEGCNSFEEQNLDNFLQIYNRYFELLYDLGKQSGANIISKEHQDISNIVEKCNAVYKPSGAGGGDLGIALTTSKDIAEKIKEEILHSEYKVINLKISKSGLTIKNYSR